MVGFRESSNRIVAKGGVLRAAGRGGQSLPLKGCGVGESADARPGL